MKHTKTPWRVGELNATGIEIKHDDNTPGANSLVIARVTARQTWLSEAEANAAFIVRACNGHDDLVKALKEIVRNDPYNQSSAGIIARAALAKAKIPP